MSEKMTSQGKTYEKYARTTITLFLIVGLWPGLGLAKFSSYLVLLYSSSISITVFAGINFIVHNLINMGDVVQAMCAYISACTARVKAAVYFLHRDDIRKMHGILETTFRRDFLSSKHQNILLSPLKYFYQWTMMISKTFMTLSIAVYIGPFISMIAQFARGAKPIVFNSVFLVKYPWNPKSNSAIYVVHYFFGSFSAMFTGFVSLSVDVGFGLYIFQIATQFRVLAYRLSSLESGSDYRHLIRECVLRRRILVKCCNSLERTCAPVVLWMTITNAMSLCANKYRLTKMSTDSIATSLLYIFMKILQALFYGWIGTFLTDETESFRDAMYSSGWAGSGDKPVMTSILIILMWKPLILTTWSFSTISLDMVVAILSTAISYFFLLQTLEESE